MSDPIIIFGSARSNGNTRNLVDEIIGDKEIPIIDLNKVDISPFDYEFRNQDDDFLDVIKEVLEHDLIVIATPVYWYSMSATMKTFFDRTTDLLFLNKDLGRKMKGKKLFVIASFNTSEPRGFEDTFQQIADYFEMEYLGTSFACSDKEKKQFENSNQKAIEKAKKIILQKK